MLASVRQWAALQDSDVPRMAATREDAAQRARGALSTGVRARGALSTAAEVAAGGASGSPRATHRGVPVSRITGEILQQQEADEGRRGKLELRARALEESAALAAGSAVTVVGTARPEYVEARHGERHRDGGAVRGGAARAARRRRQGAQNTAIYCEPGMRLSHTQLNTYTTVCKWTQYHQKRKKWHKTGREKIVMAYFKIDE